MQISWNMHGILNFLKDCGILNFFKDCGILNFFKDCGIFEVSSFLIQYSKLWKCIPISAFTLIYIYSMTSNDIKLCALITLLSFIRSISLKKAQKEVKSELFYLVQKIMDNTSCNRKPKKVFF